MLCLGQAFTDYDDMMHLCESLFSTLATEITGSTSLTFLDERVDLAKPWRRLSISEAVEQYANMTLDDCLDLNRLERAVQDLGLTIPDTPYATMRGQVYQGIVLDCVLKARVYPQLRQPTFLTEFPFFFSGPARLVDGGPCKMRAEAFIAGVEVAETAAIETDARVIHDWHAAMRENKRMAGWIQDPDVAFLDTVDRGLLSPSVLAVGIERLMMVMLGKSRIDQVLLYPNSI